VPELPEAVADSQIGLRLDGDYRGAHLRAFVNTADAVRSTTKKLEKLRLISDFLRSLGVADAGLAARFFSGRAFAEHDERTLGVGGSVLSRVIAEAAGQVGESLRAAYRKHGDLGDMT
jgi:DNA ligase 1